MNSRDNHLWLQLWRDKDIEFHQTSVNKFLRRFWITLSHTNKSRVFVPLCGKSLDMLWLAEQGHKVIGVELSPIAVKAFFKENNLRPIKKRLGKFTLWKNGNISILCGDYFSLSKTDLGNIDTVYDRSALTALPEDIRKLYVDHMREIVPIDTNIFLLTIEDIDEKILPEQVHCVDEEVKTLYSKYFHIKLAHVENLVDLHLESTTHTEYKLYQLNSK